MAVGIGTLIITVGVFVVIATLYLARFYGELEIVRLRADNQKLSQARTAAFNAEGRSLFTLAITSILGEIATGNKQVVEHYLGA